MLIRTTVRGDMKTDVDETEAEKFMLPKENVPISVNVLSPIGFSFKIRNADTLAATMKTANDMPRRERTMGIFLS